jgi:predicted DNA-binding protein (UPF0251 family)
MFPRVGAVDRSCGRHSRVSFCIAGILCSSDTSAAGRGRSQHRRNCGSGRGAIRDSSDPAETIAHAQASRELRQAILRLPVHYREVVVLCELNGLSYDDAAAIIGCPVGTVRSRLSRARQMLIERCKALLERGRRAEGIEERAESTGQGAEEREQRAEGRGKRWLIPTKNNC